MEERRLWKRRGLYALAVAFMVWGTGALAWLVTTVAGIAYAISRVLATRPLDQFGPPSTYLMILAPFVFATSLWLWFAAAGSRHRAALRIAAVLLFGYCIVEAVISIREGVLKGDIRDPTYWTWISSAAAPAGAWLFTKLRRGDRGRAVADKPSA